MERVSIIIPAYNEQEGIGRVLDDIMETMGKGGIEHEVIVVDDGSTDGTAEIAQRKGAKVIRHVLNKGYGAALKTGIRHAQYDAIVITDADGTYPSEEIPKLVNCIGEYDMVVGARTGEVVHIPLLRKPAKWILAKLANYLANMEIPDLNSGLRVMKKEIVMDFLRMLPSGFSFTTTITLAMITNDYNVKYIPINYYRRLGKSKIRPIQDTLGFVSLIVRTILCFNPLRVFLPIGAFWSLVGVVKIGYDMVTYNYHIAGSTIVIVMTALQVIVLGLVADLIVNLHRS